MDNRLHIVCLDVPFPPDYGGAVEIFYKIKYLSEQGVKIILHCFEYGRGKQPQLEKYCEQVFYYRRKKTVPLSLPYTVSSRKDKTLLKRLMSDDHPILLEGIHCTYYLYHGDLKGKNVWVRLHNVEYEYYKNLAKSSNQVFKKIYYKWESILLKKYEKRLAPSGRFLTLSKSDSELYKSLGAKTVQYLPLFIEKQQVVSLAGKGNYCLYHGNLSVVENEEASLFLMQEVFSGTNFRLMIAGKNPSKKLRRICAENRIELIANPDSNEMEKLIKNAHINVLPSMNSTGVKVKLVDSLFKGRFVIANQNALDGSGLESLCLIANKPGEFARIIEKLFNEDFPLSEIEKRENILLKEFDPEKNVQDLISLVFN